MKKLLLALFVLTVSAPAMAQTALKVNGQIISEADQKELMGLLKKEVGITKDKDLERTAREILVRQKIIGQEAWRNKLEKEPMVKSQLAAARTKIYTDQLLRNYAQKHPVTDQELEQTYNFLKRQYNPMEVKVRHLLVGTEKEAKDLLYLIEAGEDMGKIAQSKSLDKATAKEGGLLPFTNVTNFAIPNMGKIAESMKKGQVYKQPLKSKFGYSIIKVEDKRMVPYPKLEQIKEQVRAQATKAKGENYLDQLFAKAKIEPVQAGKGKQRIAKKTKK